MSDVLNEGEGDDLFWPSLAWGCDAIFWGTLREEGSGSAWQELLWQLWEGGTVIVPFYR